MYTDLHTHTYYSDGSLSPAQLLKLANEQNLSYIAITDHDSVGAYEDIKKNEIRELFDGRIIPGVELSAIYKGEIVEVLGYGFDADKMSEYIKNNVTGFIESLPEQSVLYMKAFKGYGAKFTPEFDYLASENPKELFKNSVAHTQQLYLDDMRKFPENAKFFESYEHMMTISEKDFSRNYIYNPKSTLYVDLSSLFLSVKQAADLIHKAGGLAFFAHTFVYSENIVNSLTDIAENYNLDGFEISYPTFSKKQKDFLYDFAKNNNMFMSGGSDFHGLDIKPNNPLGIGTNNEKINISLSQNWISKINTI